ncbi:MAG: hypothetical protein HQL73_02050 [Magnetococcales bacterium]|nr:hypothetical protein [Magnetococcales bacterium]
MSDNDGRYDQMGSNAGRDWWLRFESLLEQKTGLSLAHPRSLIADLVGQRMTAWNLSDRDAYLSLLYDIDKGRWEWSVLLSALPVHESYFFRDPDQFSVIREQLLPELWRGKRGQEGELSIWSAGCASGEEAYTLAMILEDWSVATTTDPWPIRILGTDMDPNGIQQAREGRYRSWSFRSVAPEVLATFFHAEGDQWYRIDSRLRNRVRFEELNLLEAEHHLGQEPRFDLVLCRNVFIYLSPQAVRHILTAMHALLRPGGYLVTGHAELDLQLVARHGYRTRNFPHSRVYQKPLPGEEPVGSSPLSRGGFKPGSPWSVQAPNPRPSTDHSPGMSSGRPGLAVSGDDGAGPDMVCARMRRHIVAGRHAAAQAEGEAARPIHPNDAPIQTMLAWALANLGRSALAEESCLEAIRMDPTASEPHHLLGQILSETQRFAEAEGSFRMAIYLDPGDILAMIELGNTLARLGRRQEARREWMVARNLLAREPDDRQVGVFEHWSVASLKIELERLLREGG